MHEKLRNPILDTLTQLQNAIGKEKEASFRFSRSDLWARERGVDRDDDDPQLLIELPVPGRFSSARARSNSSGVIFLYAFLMQSREFGGSELEEHG
ncbi:hypothetical protein niasHT_039195 [Heterodera trifolii]|uniref:Uncharacterized protein n=1 Tax=Heterodera trifolii TaxID=157864 RepID=A0ABD2IC49_9BILA